MSGQEGMRRSGPLRFLLDQIAQAPHTTRMLREATLASGPFVIRDWSYISDEVVGDGYILVGDAACWALWTICPPGTRLSVPGQDSRRVAMSGWCWSMVRRPPSLSTVSTP